MSSPTPCTAVGLHSLHLDKLAGSKFERHVVQVDLDSPRPVEEPSTFRVDVLEAMKRHNVGTVYAFRTLKGVHLFSPALVSRRVAERFEEDLEAWGADGFHRFMGWKNGGTVMRLTAKPGEPEGIQLLATFTNPAATTEWSGAHLDMMASLHPRLRHPAHPDLRNDDAEGNVRLEHYSTTAAAGGA